MLIGACDILAKHAQSTCDVQQDEGNSVVCRNEVEAVVTFYEELCQIAQVLKAVDPFCMLFLQQVSLHSIH